MTPAEILPEMPVDRGAGGQRTVGESPGGDGCRLAIQSGRADEMRAEIGVVVRRDRPAVAAGVLRLSGTLTGPIRGRDVTLPTTVPLVGMPEVSRADLAAARAVFTEPAYWSPELPNLYRLSAELRGESGDGAIATFERLIGLRRLGVRGRSFWLEGRRWVPRGVACAGQDFEPAAFRSAHAVAVIDDPAEEVCAAADRVGVAIIARLAAGTGVEAAARAVARWAMHPSVVLVVVPRASLAVGAEELIAGMRPKQSTLLVAVEVDGLVPPGSLPSALGRGVDCLVVDLPEGRLPHEAWRSAASQLPLVARRSAAIVPAAEERGILVARRTCDSLQAELAAWGCVDGCAGLGWDWAGYACRPGEDAHG